jgi:predicted TIM-barrel fold metal-dependent hydrolase
MILIRKKIALQLGIDSGKYDTHTHIFEHKLITSKKVRYKPSYDAKIETLIKALHKNRLNGAFLVQPSFYGSNNNYIIKKLKKHNHKKLYGVGVLSETKPLRDFKKILKNKFIGVRLNLYKRKIFKFNNEWNKVFELMIIHKLHLEIYVENKKLVTLINSLPKKLIKIIDHCGTIQKESELKWIDKVKEKDNIFVKCTHPFRLKKDFKTGDKLMSKFITYFSKKIGKEKILWGSDFPWTGYENKINDYSSVNRLAKNYSKQINGS